MVKLQSLMYFIYEKNIELIQLSTENVLQIIQIRI